jgi:hypothetical protein
MPHRRGTFADLFYVHWLGPPIPRELEEIEPDVEKLWKRLGRKIVYLTVVPPDAPVPSADERKALDAFALRIRPWVDHAYLVLEGEGFKASIQRSVVIGLTLFKERGYTTICKDVPEAIAKIAARTKGDRDTMLAAARGNGLTR